MLINLDFSDAKMGFLSQRATEAVGGLDLPWRFAPRGDYDADHNPNGLVSFGTAEHVREPFSQSFRMLTILGFGDEGFEGVHRQECMSAFANPEKRNSLKLTYIGHHLPNRFPLSR